ncbi:hypothetical protein X943_001739 [Babesia divergens]|uniref:Uncharacterized protein n=1 Tax=Babesia divergens TaxID=32595 RepID=A0AAD9GFB8_BABDI|nr:hypothetical protein X943_001739 [Babesia divergens]
MAANPMLQCHLRRLCLLSGNVSLFKHDDNAKVISNTIKECKRLLIAKIQRNAISDQSIIQAADCLYDLKASDINTSAHICKAVEVRPSIYTRPLYGGILWSFHTSAGMNTERKKVVKSSCNASLKAFMDDLLELKTNEKLAVKLDNTLRNLTIVGYCFKLPVPTRTRLEQAIVDARDVLYASLKASPTSIAYLSALKSLQIRCETVAGDAVASFLNTAAHHELLSIAAIVKAIKTLQTWGIGTVGASYSAVEMLNKQILSPPQLLLKSTSAVVKFYVASTRVGQRAGSLAPSDDVDNSNATTELPLKEGSTPSNVMGSRKSNGIQKLSKILLNYCIDLVDRCNNRNLLLLYNSMAYHIWRDEGRCDLTSEELQHYVHRVTSAVRGALQLDMAAEDRKDGLSMTVYDKKDLLTILRSALIAGRVCEDGPSEVANIAKRMLVTIYGVKPDEIASVTMGEAGEKDIQVNEEKPLTQRPVL